MRSEEEEEEEGEARGLNKHSVATIAHKRSHRAVVEVTSSFISAPMLTDYVSRYGDKS